MIKMPGKTYIGSLSPLTTEELHFRDQMRKDLEHLAGEIGERHIHQYVNLCAAADFIHRSFEQAGYAPKRQNYDVFGKTCSNIEVEIPGNEKVDEIVVIGAHYDTVFGSPGANDNGSGVVALLALARAIYGKDLSRTIRFVAFVNEEPPNFMSGTMGSLVYAKQCRKNREKIYAMFSLETIGYFSEEPRSQQYPFPVGIFYPSTGNFIAFVSNLTSRWLVEKVIASFRRQVQFPSEGGAWPGIIPGIAWSDQWAFWKMGYPALMVTDTAPFRYPYYHTSADTANKIDYDNLSRVVVGLKRVICDLVGGSM